MNPITFNDKFIAAIVMHPQSKTIANIFGNWRVAPLFDYETTWEKEVALTPKGVGLSDITEAQWPFETFRLAMTERNIPRDETTTPMIFDTYKTDLVANRVNGQVHILVAWRRWHDAPQAWAEVMLHIYTHNEHGEYFPSASIFSPRRGWQHNINESGVSMIAGSAVASFGAFVADAQSPTNHLVEIRPNQPDKSVEWTRARTHFTFITHGHPANQRLVQVWQRVKSDRDEELKRAAHNRKAHKRTLRAARFTYARGQTIDVKATWVGPKEWMDEGGRQIYRILEPVGPPS
jgi:hypothetical protein